MSHVEKDASLNPVVGYEKESKTKLGNELSQEERGTGLIPITDYEKDGRTLDGTETFFATGDRDTKLNQVPDKERGSELEQSRENGTTMT